MTRYFKHFLAFALVIALPCVGRAELGFGGFYDDGSGLGFGGFNPTAPPSPTISQTLTISPTFTETTTFTISPTLTATPTITETPTPGEGDFVFAPGAMTVGSRGNGFDLSFVAGASAFSASGGLVTIYFPPDLGNPNGLFYVHPQDLGFVQAVSFQGQTVTVNVIGLPAYGVLRFRYGQTASGFPFNSNVDVPLALRSYPQSVSLGAGGYLIPSGPGALMAQSPTVTPTYTVTLTPTITLTLTVSPTFSVTPTITQTFTETPVGAVQDNAVYSYPNPFDKSRFDKVTFRFPVDSGVAITVFNLAGEPVRDIPAGDINEGQGWAIWGGLDDIGRRVAGGLYFVRVRGSARVLMRKFVVVY